MGRVASLLRVVFPTALGGLLYYWGLPTACVRLPSGVNIGEKAVLDVSAAYIRPSKIVKYENGTPLLSGDIWPLFATQTTVHGLALGNGVRGDLWFAWRQDTGLVLKSENPTRYAVLVAEAGNVLGGITVDAVGPGIYFRTLQDDPAYSGQYCRTRWITW
ncbi:MAG: hypothetical protein AAGI03_13845 [Pseudomonadota bacterium]